MSDSSKQTQLFRLKMYVRISIKISQETGSKIPYALLNMNNQQMNHKIDKSLL
jgi:hypothetical protein